MMGLEGLPIVTSPLAGNLEDLHEFTKRVILAKPWQYDHTVKFQPSLFFLFFFFWFLNEPFFFKKKQCVPLPWQNVNLQDEGRKLKWGVIWEDG